MELDFMSLIFMTSSVILVLSVIKYSKSFMDMYKLDDIWPFKGGSTIYIDVFWSIFGDIVFLVGSIVIVNVFCSSKYVGKVLNLIFSILLIVRVAELVLGW